MSHGIIFLGFCGFRSGSSEEGHHIYSSLEPHPQGPYNPLLYPYNLTGQQDLPSTPLPWQNAGPSGKLLTSNGIWNGIRRVGGERGTVDPKNKSLRTPLIRISLIAF